MRRAAFGCNSCKEWHDGGGRKRQHFHMLVSLAVFLLLSIKHRSNGWLKVTCRVCTQRATSTLSDK